MNKYNADSSCGFASKLEAAVYQILKFKVKAGLIKSLECQSSVELTNANIRCKIDFSYIDTVSLEKCWAEAKGIETDRWQIIQKLWKFYGPGKLLIYKGSYQSPRLVEILTPLTHKES